MRKKAVPVMQTIFLIFSFVLTLAGVGSALDYPTKPVQIIVPYPPGGTNDMTARILEPKLASLLGQSVMVVNKPGGGGATGIKFATTVKPDGYTRPISAAFLFITLIMLLTSFYLYLKRKCGSSRKENLCHLGT